MIKGSVKEQHSQSIGEIQRTVMPGIKSERKIEKNGAAVQQTEPFQTFLKLNGIGGKEEARHHEKKGDGNPCQHSCKEKIGFSAEGSQRRGVYGNDKQSGNEAETVKPSVILLFLHFCFATSILSE